MRPIEPSLLRLAPALKAHLVGCGIGSAIVAVAVLTQAEVLADGLARLVAGDGSGLAGLVGALAVIAVVRGAVAGATELLSDRTMREARRSIRTSLLDHAGRLGPDGADRVPPSRITALVTTGLDQLEPYVRGYLPNLTAAAFIPLAAGARILWADWPSAVILLVAVPLIPVFMVLIGQMTESRTRRQWAVLQRLGGHFLDVMAGLPTLRMFGRAEAQIARVRDVTDEYRRATLATLRVAFLSAFALELLATLSVALVAASVGIRLAGGGLDLTTALVVLLLAPECSVPLRRVGAGFHAATAGLDAANDVGDALEVAAPTSGQTAVSGPGTLSLAGVAVARPGRGNVVEAIDLAVAPGTMVALSGPSGAGKTSILQVARQRIDPAAGAIAHGGTPLASMDPDAWNAHVVWLPQRPVAIGATLVEAAIGGAGEVADPAAAAASARGALDRVGLGPWADRDPATLSGGQLRRLDVARAEVAIELTDAGLVVADEPSAHLDDAAAERVVDALARMRAAGAGLLVATHDPRVTAVADDVVTVTPASSSAGAAGPTPADREQPADVVAPTAGPARPPEPLPTEPVPTTTTTATGASTTPAPVDQGSAGAIRRVLALARPVRGRLAAAALVGAAAEACTLGLAGTAAWLIVRAAEEPPILELTVAVTAVRAFGIGKGALRYAERLATHDAGFRVLGELRTAVVARLGRVAPAGLPGWSTGDVVSRVVDDIDRLQDLFVRIGGPAAAAMGAATGAVVIAAFVDPVAGAVLAGVLVAMAFALPGAATAAASRTAGPVLTARAEVAGRVLTYTEAIDAHVAHGTAAAQRSAIEDAARAADEVTARRSRATAITAALGAAAPLVAVIAVAAAVGPATAGLGGPALGVLVLWPLAIVEVLVPLTTTAELVPTVAASAMRVTDLLDLRDPMPEPAAPVTVPARPALRTDRLDVGWPGDPPVIRDLDLDVPAGGRLAVVGPSGAGKSTLAAALVGFLPPRDGHYRLGGVESLDAGGANVRHRVVWCEQTPWIADATVRDNLRIARPDATDDELVEALAAVRLGPWLERLPDGLSTPVGRGGDRLSGGERQRLAVARTRLAGHDVLVLDEPIAHLDRPTAERLLGDLLGTAGGRSVILISHDLVPAELTTVTLGVGAREGTGDGGAGVRTGER
ncbi:MAG: thiol reductant ABC exporter subunit CydD [Actinomycetota bacterium]|nr:thiol reductant ABC exporter subunit CydD [Actinomycetota bacterium]